jgi:hypothetical protein
MVVGGKAAIPEPSKDNEHQGKRTTERVGVLHTKAMYVFNVP